MADDTNIEDKKVKDGSIFFSYLVVVLFLAVLAVLIVMKALNTAFVEKDRWLALAKTQIMPGIIIFFLFVITCSIPTFIFQPLYNLPVLTAAVRLPLLRSMHLIMLCSQAA